MIDVALNYLKITCFVTLEIILAFFAAKFAANKWPTISSTRSRLVLFLIGCGSLLVSATGRLGWSIQTWGGGSRAEALDQATFWVLSVVGTFLLISDYCLGYFP